MSTYIKFRFVSSVHGATAGLVMTVERFGKGSISDLSRFFPMSEGKKMVKLEVSPIYPTFDSAFDHQFTDRSVI